MHLEATKTGSNGDIDLSDWELDGMENYEDMGFDTNEASLNPSATNYDDYGTYDYSAYNYEDYYNFYDDDYDYNGSYYGYWASYWDSSTTTSQCHQNYF